MFIRFQKRRVPIYHHLTRFSSEKKLFPLTILPISLYFLFITGSIISLRVSNWEQFPESQVAFFGAFRLKINRLHFQLIWEENDLALVLLTFQGETKSGREYSGKWESHKRKTEKKLTRTDMTREWYWK